MIAHARPCQFGAPRGIHRRFTGTRHAGRMDAAPPPQAATGAEGMAAALLESRARWRDFALMASDLVFETDGLARFSFLLPEIVLGYASATLLGTRAAGLLAPGSPDPFVAQGPLREQRAWLKTAEGAMACLSFTLAPCGTGLRGVARDVTAEERQSAAAASVLRRAMALGRLLRLGQGHGVAEARLDAMLAGLLPALGCEGVALLEVQGESWAVVRGAGSPPPLASLPPPPGQAVTEGRCLLMAGAGGPALLAWRADEAPCFDADDREVLEALALPLAATLAEMRRQGDLARLARTDPLTGLLNRRGFLEALAPRLAAGRPGRLAFLDLDRLKPLNDRLGHDAGDAALLGLAGRIRESLGPRDLAGRLGGDEFALWAEDMTPDLLLSLGQAGPVPGWPEAGPDALRASFGVVEAQPGEGVEMLLARADAAMYRAKREARR